MSSDADQRYPAPAEPCAIPRFASLFVQHARSCGLDAKLVLETFDWNVWPWGDETGPAVMLHMQGNSEQFRALGFFGDKFAFPVGRRMFGVAQAGGYMDLDQRGNGTLVIFLCRLPKAIAVDDGVEYVSYSNVTLYHGTKQQVNDLARGCDVRFPGRKSHAARNLWRGRHWQIRRFRDDSYLLTLENEDVFRRREAEETKERLDVQPEKTPTHYQSADHFKDRLAVYASTLMDVVLDASAGDGHICLSQISRQNIARLGEQLKHLLTTADVMTLGPAIAARPVLRLVVNNVAQAEA